MWPQYTNEKDGRTDERTLLVEYTTALQSTGRPKDDEKDDNKPVQHKSSFFWFPILIYFLALKVKGYRPINTFMHMLQSVNIQ